MHFGDDGAKPGGGAARRNWAAAGKLMRQLLWDVIDPRGSFRKHWDSLLLLAMAFLIIEVPFVTCFDVTYAPRDALGAVIDIYFVTDVWLNFRTGILGEWSPAVCHADALSAHQLQSMQQLCTTLRCRVHAFHTIH